MPSTIMTYGAYNFSPVPLMGVSREFNRVADRVFGFTNKITLNGSLIPSGDLGILSIDALQDDLANAISTEGKEFVVSCGGTDILRCRPKKLSLAFEEGQWVNQSKYNISLEYDQLASGITDYIADYNEEWSFENVDDKSRFSWTLSNGVTELFPNQYRLNHSVSVTGKDIFNAEGSVIKPAWQQARDFIRNDSLLNLNPAYIRTLNSGIINLSADMKYTKHFRAASQNETAGSYQVTENWTLLDHDASSDAAIEDFNIDIRSSTQNPIKQVSIQGTVTGLETRDYTTDPASITQSRYAAATEYFAGIKSNIYTRCNTIFSSAKTNSIISSPRSLNPTPLSLNYGENPYSGTITYSYEFDDRPLNCLSNALHENFTITESNPKDLYASVFVLGKTNGPVLQDLGTKSAGQRSLSIEAVLQPITVCPSSNSAIATLLAPFNDSEVEAIVNHFTTELESNYDSVFIEQNDKSWSPKEGRYTRNVTWVYSGC